MMYNCNLRNANKYRKHQIINNIRNINGKLKILKLYDIDIIR